MSQTPVALTIAGSDSSGGAGIQADIKTFSALGVYGASVITAITAQNTLGVQGVNPIDASWVKKQLESVLSDLSVGAIKTGMLHNEKVIAVITKSLSNHKIPSKKTPLIIDPVMVSTSGKRLLNLKSVEILKEKLLPQASLITPNIKEAAVLLKCRPAKSIKDMQQQAKQLLHSINCEAVLLKGGHLHEKSFHEQNSERHSADVLISKKINKIFHFEKIQTQNTHGTGCTLSAAITSYLAQGADLLLAVTAAREYVHNAILQADDLFISKKNNKGRNGPVHNFY